MILRYFLFFAILLMFGFSAAHAEDVFCWDNTQGQLTCGNKPPTASINKKRVSAQLSTYSTKQVFQRYGIDSTQLKTNQSSNVATNPISGNSPSETKIAALSHDNPQIVNDVAGQILSCSVNIQNVGGEPAQNVAISFEFSDGTLIAAEGSNSIPAGESIEYAIGANNLPLIIRSDGNTNRRNETSVKVVMRFE